MVRHIYTYDDPPAIRDVKVAVECLRSDGVIAYPTGHNWAFGCDATSYKGLERIQGLKPSHPRDRPFSLVCSNISMAAEYVNIDNTAYRLLKKAWPGPYTVLLTATRNFPRLLKDKRRVVGIRVPECPLVHAIVESLGRPLATTSVPAFEHTRGDVVPVFPKYGHEVAEHWGHALDLILDLGNELPGSESTIVDMTEGVPVIVREGSGDPKLFAP